MLSHLTIKISYFFISIFSVRTWNSVIEKPKFWRWAIFRLNSGNYQEIIQSLQTGQTRVNNIQQIRVCLQEAKDNTWVLNILEDLVTAVLDDDSQLKSPHDVLTSADLTTGS